ncbi:MAG: ABC transporter permease [Deltaproteobacteria bacterium]|nr:ABC transporter permease [Deltaproteobacteria bacterium]
MRGIAKLTWVEAKLFCREPLAAFFTLVFPVILLLVFGSIFGNAPVPDYEGFGFVDASIPGYAALIIATSGLLSLSTAVAGYREQGVLRRLHVTPLHPGAVLLAQIVVMFAMTTIGMGLLVAIGRAIFALKCPGSVPLICVGFVFSCLCFFALGIALASAVSSVRTAQAVGMAVFYPMIFLSGAAIPRELLPDGVQRAAAVLPLTHVVTLLRALWIGEAWTAHLGVIGLLTAVAAASSAIAVRSFRWE